MKKYIAVIAGVLALIMVFCSCSKSETDANAGTDSVVNPMTVCDLTDISDELSLKPIKFDDKITVDSVYRIDMGDDAIYSIDIVKDEKSFNIRLSKGNEDDKDISGVTMSGDVQSSIFDSDNINMSPTMYVEAGEEGIKAYCTWKDCNFSIFTADKISTYSFQNFTVEMIQTVINHADFEIIFEQSNQAKLIDIVNEASYPVKVYYGNVFIYVKDKHVPFAEAIKKRIVSPDDILSKCEQDSKDGKVKVIIYKDGGSKEYRYKTYTVLKMNTLDGDDTMIIGPKGDLSNVIELL